MIKSIVRPSGLKHLPRPLRSQLAELRDEAAALVQIADRADESLGIARSINDERDRPLRLVGVQDLYAALGCSSLADCKEAIRSALPKIERAGQEDQTEADQAYEIVPQDIREMRQVGVLVYGVTSHLLGAKERVK